MAWWGDTGDGMGVGREVGRTKGGESGVSPSPLADQGLIGRDYCPITETAHFLKGEHVVQCA